MMVGLQGKEPERRSADSDTYGVRIIEPVLDAMSIRHRAVETANDVAQISSDIDRAYRDSMPFVHLIGRAPAA